MIINYILSKTRVPSLWTSLNADIYISRTIIRSVSIRRVENVLKMYEILEKRFENVQNPKNITKKCENSNDNASLSVYNHNVKCVRGFFF